MSDDLLGDIFIVVVAVIVCLPVLFMIGLGLLNLSLLIAYRFMLLWERTGAPIKARKLARKQALLEEAEEAARIQRQKESDEAWERRCARANSDDWDDYDDSGRGMWATGGYDPERYASQAREIGYGNIDMVREVYGSFDDYFANRPGD